LQRLKPWAEILTFWLLAQVVMPLPRLRLRFQE
jgi:hypothetical protein